MYQCVVSVSTSHIWDRDECFQFAFTSKIVHLTTVLIESMRFGMDVGAYTWVSRVHRTPEAALSEACLSICICTPHW